MAVHFEVISKYQDFAVLRKQWNELCRMSEVDHAFMRHGWFDCRMRHLDDVQNICFVIGRRNNRLVAAAPLMLVRRRMKGVNVKLLTFAASTITPRSSFLAERPEDLHGMLDFISSMRNYNLFLASGMDKEASPTRIFIEHLELNKPGFWSVEQARQSPYVLADDDWDHYYNSLSRSFRTLLRRAESKLAAGGNAEVVCVGDYETMHDLLPTLIDVSAKSWKAQGNTDLSSLPQVVAFLDDFSHLSEDNKLWELWLLKLDDKIIAFDYYLRGNNSLSLIRTDFDLAFKQVSPGNNLQLGVMKNLFQRNETWEYDMGGQDYDYKLKWTDKIRTHVDIMMAGNGWYGKILMRAKTKALPVLKKLFGRGK